MLLFSFSNFILETGTDEAGRGCLKFPVKAVAVFLQHSVTSTQGIEINYRESFCKLINNSKQLSKKLEKN